MKVLRSWLREFAPIDADVATISDALGALGTPVEDVEHIGADYDGIVVARVLELRPHPKPDVKGIQLVLVDAGTGEPIQVACGAFNMQVGDLVPLATVGTLMPNGMAIGRRKMQGEWSNGMLCSAGELNLGPSERAILVLDGAVPADVELGTPMRDAMGIEPDVLWDLEINPNRPDAMSVAGVARDLAAWFRVPFSLPAPEVAEDGDPVGSLVTVEVLDQERCGRFTARVLQDVTVGPSPQRIATRLTLLGMRPINNVVDVSNYVMLELGQPSHPYDLALVGGGGLRVRRARAGETLVTLDDVERTFTEDDLLICDANDVPNGIAGLMGGASSEISSSTRDVLVEMAWFLPIGVAKTGRRLGLRSEASARFEKGCDPEIIELAQGRFAELLDGAVGRVAKGLVDVRGELPDPGPVRVRTAKVNAVLGTSLGRDEMKAFLDPIGFSATPVGDDLDVEIPTWRYDSAVEIDVVEEVARHYGYEKIGQAMPTAVRIGALTPAQHDRRFVRNVLAGLGLAEAYPLPFLAPDDLSRSGLAEDGISITNPLVAEESVLRTSLLPGLLRTIAYNESHRVAGARLFEIGHVFRRPAVDQPLPDEREHAAVAIAGAEAPSAVQIWEALGEALAVADRSLRVEPVAGLHATRSASIVVAGEVVGAVGEVDPDVLDRWRVSERVAWLEVDLGRILELPHGRHDYRLVSKYPSSDIDLAFDTAESVPAADIESTIRSAAGELLARLQLFDVYRGEGLAEGRRSLAYRLRLQAPDRTLTDAEVAEVRSACIATVESAHDAKLRG